MPIENLAVNYWLIRNCPSSGCFIRASKPGLLLTNNDNDDRLTAFDPGQPGWAGTRRNIHPLTPIRIIVLFLSPFSICNGPWHPLYSTYVLDSPHVQPLSRSSLVFPLVLDPQLHAPYISSPSHRHLFATHDRTSAACSAAIPMLCHLPLVSLSAPYLGVYLLA